MNPKRSEGFYAAVRRYWQNLKDGALQPDYSGLEPRLFRQTPLRETFALMGQGIIMVCGDSITYMALNPRD